MNLRTPRAHGSAGFSLVEVLAGLAVLSLIAVAVAAVSLSGVVRTSDNSRERQDDATAAQWTSLAFARDVQAASGTAAECSPGSGTRLVTLQSSDDGDLIEYRVLPSEATFGVYRVECGAGGSTRKVVDGLEEAPTVTCDGVPCVDGSTPRVVTLDVARTPTFRFELDGARRTTDGNSESGPLEAPSFMSLGGDTPLAVTGTSQLRVVGNALINKPTSGTTAVSLNGSSRLDVEGEFRLESGATCTNCETNANKVPGTFSTKIPDPLRFVPAPEQATLTGRTNCPVHDGVRVCQPGIYDAEFPPSLGGGGVKDFVLEPGVYVLRGGMKVTNGSVTSLGGVLLYNEAGSVKITGADLDLTPPATGIHTGILLFQARDNNAGIEIRGNASLASLVGTIYAPASSGVVLGGGGGELYVGRVVGSSLSTSGNGTVVVDGS